MVSHNSDSDNIVLGSIEIKVGAEIVSAYHS